jgi:predicted branched-subunit amino acid permease
MTREAGEAAAGHDQAGRDQAGRAASPVRDGVGLGLAVGLSGLAFGAAAAGAGLSAWQACALSALAFTGASQFALVGAVAAGGSLAAATAGAILLGSRNTLYGLRLAGLLRLRGGRRLAAALGVIDETTAVALAQPDPRSGRISFAVTFGCLYLTWNACTLVGALGAGTLASPRALGLDVVGPAAFLALIWPRLRAGRTERAVAVAGVAIALGLTPVLPPGVPVILAASAALGGTLARSRLGDPGHRGPGRPGLTETLAGPGTRP